MVVDGVESCMLLDLDGEGLLVCCGGCLARFVVAKMMSLLFFPFPQRVVPPTSKSHPATVEHECHESLLLCHTSLPRIGCATMKLKYASGGAGLG